MSKPVYAVLTDTSHVLRCRVRLGLVPPVETGETKKERNPGTGFRMRARISTRYVVGDAGMQDELIGWALQWHGSIGLSHLCRAPRAMGERARGVGVEHEIRRHRLSIEEQCVL